MKKVGYLVHDTEPGCQDLMQDEEAAMAGVVGASITYRRVIGPNARLIDVGCMYAFTSVDTNDRFAHVIGQNMSSAKTCHRPKHVIGQK